MVCEASSFQLEDTLRFAPDAGVLLNLAEDHLDRHGTFDAYQAAKLEVFARQPAGHRRGRQRAAGGGRRRRGRAGAVRPRRGRPAARRATGALWWDGEPLIAPRRDPPARRPQPRERDGRRRGRRSPAGCRSTRSARASRRSAASRTGSRRSPPHDGVLYVNDSKATNVASAIAGIEAFEGGVHVILGGSGKGADYAPLAAPLAAARARRLPDRRDRGRARRGAGRRPACRCTRCGDLERAVAAARRGGAARRRRPALTRLRVLRPVPPTTRSAATHFRARQPARIDRQERPGGVEASSDGRRRQAAAAPGAPAAATATLCLLAGGAVMVYSASSARDAAAGPGRRHRLPRQVRHLRRRSGWSRCTCSRATGSSSVRALHAAAAARLASCCCVLVHAPRLRREGQRRPPLARRRPAAVPARPS